MTDKKIIEEWERVELLDRVGDYNTEWLIETSTRTAIGMYDGEELIGIEDIELKELKK